MEFGEMVNPPTSQDDQYTYSQTLGAEDQEIEFLDDGYVTFTKKFENFGPGCNGEEAELHEVTKNGKTLQARDKQSVQ